MKKIGAIIQARMNSSRLPGKVMMKLGNKLVIERIVSRLSKSKSLDFISVATSTEPSDDILYHWCTENKINCFRGSENDVLDRYKKAMEFYGLGAVVRITGDCPLIDPMVVDALVQIYQLGLYDCVCLAGGFPDGLDCQIFSYSSILDAWTNAKLPSDREHVGSYIENTNASKFKLLAVEIFKDLNHHRWTIDEKADLKFLQNLIKILDEENTEVTTKAILECIRKNPKISCINSHIPRNEGYRRMRESEKNHG